MVYVDLNPIRSKIANTPEESEFTSIKKRINISKSDKKLQCSLEVFVGIQEQKIGIPFKLLDYLGLVDWTGRVIRDDKRGAIATDLPPILKRLEIDIEA